MPAPHTVPSRLVDEPLLSRAFARSNAPRWGLSRESFARALERSIASRFATEVKTPVVVQEYVNSLNLEELALACACAEGQVSAWAYFIECHRPGLRAAARAIAGDSDGTELADSLYAELYGLEERDGCRRSLFDYFHGRSRLSTWLRAILAQRNVDRIRMARRLRPLDDEAGIADAGRGPTPQSDEGVPDPDRRHFAMLAQRAVAGAIGRLEAHDRLRLASYYVQRLTLAQIGRLMGEHEATVSRKLERIRRRLKSEVERTLRTDHHFDDRQVAACLDYALDDVGVDLERAMGQQETPDGSF
ncbi:MAG TPA: sigma-70 family RNA polymerase sigma factor [Vicinamibacterales bacterium]|jgi:RNA polymerase sigma-70 factor (ECF subfamily)